MRLVGIVRKNLLNCKPLFGFTMFTKPHQWKTTSSKQFFFIKLYGKSIPKYVPFLITHIPLNFRVNSFNLLLLRLWLWLLLSWRLWLNRWVTLFLCWSCGIIIWMGWCFILTSRWRLHKISLFQLNNIVICVFRRARFLQNITESFSINVFLFPE
jgi:hypothetical protein